MATAALRLAPGMLMLIALRAALTGLDWPWIAVPLIAHDQVRGVLYLDTELSRARFSDDDLRLFAVLANSRYLSSSSCSLSNHFAGRYSSAQINPRI